MPCDWIVQDLVAISNIAKGNYKYNNAIIIYSISSTGRTPKVQKDERMAVSNTICTTRDFLGGSLML